MNTPKWLMGVAGAAFFGTALGLTLGAGNPPAVPAPTAPKYAVQYAGPVLLITDNTANKTYVYRNTGGAASELIQTVDLNDTGKAELVAVKP